MLTDPTAWEATLLYCTGLSALLSLSIGSSSVKHPCTCKYVVVQVTAGLSNLRYRGKSQYGGNLSSQYAATPGTTVMGNLQLNNERAGKMTLRVSSHDYPNLGFSLLVPTVAYIWGRLRGRD